MDEPESGGEDIAKESPRDYHQENIKAQEENKDRQGVNSEEYRRHLLATTVHHKLFGEMVPS